MLSIVAMITIFMSEKQKDSSFAPSTVPVGQKETRERRYRRSALQHY